MKKQIKIVIVAVIIIAIAAAFGYYSYEKHNVNRRIQTSEKIMKDKGIKKNNKDKAITDEMLKNDSELEYAYIKHNGETIMLNLQFKKGISDKDKLSKISKCMEKVRNEYKNKNVNTTIIPSK